MKQIVIPYSLVLLYLFVGFVPYLYAIYKYATQYLYLSGLNILFLVYLFVSKVSISEIFKNLIFVLYVIFFLWGLFTYFYALNKIEVLVSSSRILVYLLSMFNLYFLFKKLKNIEYFLSLTFTIILFSEISYILYSFFSKFNFIDFHRSGDLRGFTGNINIAAFSILLKLPFTFSLFFNEKKRFYGLSMFFYFVVFSTLFLLGSRGANIALVILILSFIFCMFIFFKTAKNNLIKISILIIPLLTAVGINTTLIEDNTVNVAKRTINISTQSTNDRLRYYSQAIETIQESPIIGIGLGNWKIHSIKKDMKNIENYIVPYHVHNDFLQIAAEIGLFGIFIYLLILIITSLKLLSFLKLKEFSEKKFFVIVILLSIMVYVIDSSINFPYTRPVVYLPVIVFLSYTMNLISLKNE